MKEYVFRESLFGDVGLLRNMQTNDLKGQVHDPLERAY